MKKKNLRFLLILIKLKLTLHFEFYFLQNVCLIPKKNPRKKRSVHYFFLLFSEF